MGWFREEPTLDYDSLTNEEAEAALQALMEATIEVGLQHVPRRMEPNPPGAAGPPTIHRRVTKPLGKLHQTILLAPTQVFG